MTDKMVAVTPQTRSIRWVILATLVGVVGSIYIALPAYAPVVGKPPAPGYPNCTKVGDDGPNTIRGTKKRDVICADEGNDRVYGLEGNDWLFGGPGKDKLYGGPGDDKLRGWELKDELYGEEGNDFLNGELGNDLIVGGPGKDEFLGSSGDDCMYALDGEGGDVLKGMIGRDSYQADADDEITGSTEDEVACWKNAPPPPTPSPSPSPSPSPTA